MIPTDDQLNIAVSELLGWKWYRYTNMRRPFRILLDPRKETLMGLYRNMEEEADKTEEPSKAQHYPGFCNDRNQLPLLWEFVTSMHSNACIDSFLKALQSDLGNSQSLWPLVTCRPRNHVIAVLKTFALWQEDWTTE